MNHPFFPPVLKRDGLFVYIFAVCRFQFIDSI